MSEMKQLVFGAGLLEPSIAGEKKITLRKYRAGSHDFSRGEIVRGAFKDGVDILLTITADTEKKPFSALTDGEAQEDGFEGTDDAFCGLLDSYPEFKRSDTIAVIRFAVATVDGIPAIQYNEYASR